MFGFLKRGRFLKKGGRVLKNPVEVLKEFDSPLPTLSVSPLNGEVLLKCLNSNMFKVLNQLILIEVRVV